MYLTLAEDRIPGTILKKSAMGNVTGLEFLQKIFYISQGIMLSQIREISGIDGSTLQNWTKRGWVANAKLKKYNIEQVSRILIINMLRDCMQLDRIIFLLRYVNGDEHDNAAIIPEAQLYDYLCRIIDALPNNGTPVTDLRSLVEAELSDYTEPISGAKNRLANALEIMIIAHYASDLKAHSDARLLELMQH
ncbi:MAG: DUF1836 domain-containing protein [Clostridia bacterium]|nr:DUF1836 domain-containing protein [Clostridia bacterium]